MTSCHICELARRRSANVEITLLWNRRSHHTWISVRDLASDDEETLVVPNERALDAFNHPFAYMAA